MPVSTYDLTVALRAAIDSLQAACTNRQGAIETLRLADDEVIRCRKRVASFQAQVIARIAEIDPPEQQRVVIELPGPRAITIRDEAS